MLMNEIGMGKMVVREILANIYEEHDEDLMWKHFRTIMKMETAQFENHLELVKIDIVRDKLVTEIELNRINRYIAEVKEYF